MALSWAVLRILAGLDAGQRVERGLMRLDYRYYNPTTYEEWVTRGRRIQRTVQLFPGYLFVWVTEQWRILLGVRGVVGIIQDADGPLTISDHIVDGLKSDAGTDGVIRLPGAPSRFRNGQSVILNNGPFDHKIVVYQGMCGVDRAAVMLRMLGKQVRIVVPENALADVI